MKLLMHGSKVDLLLERQFGSELFTYKMIFTMLIPLILDQFFINIIGLVTTAMISSSSQESVSAVSMINPLSMIIWAVFSAISVGGTVVVAQYKGSGNEAKIKDAAGQVMLATFFGGDCFMRNTCSIFRCICPSYVWCG